MSRYVIQQKSGKKKGKRGVTIVIFNESKKQSKCLTVHGYSLQDAFDMVYFSFYNEDYEMNEYLRRESARWGLKRDEYLVQKKEKQQRKC